MSIGAIHIPAMADTDPSTLTLAELAAAAGLQARTLRSWVAQGLLPGPLSRGPLARYPAEALPRVLAVRAMRDRLGMPLAAIRQELLVATPAQLEAHAAKAAGLAPEAPDAEATAETALDYLRALRSRVPAAPSPPLAMSMRPEPPASMPQPAPPVSGFAALEQQLGEGRASPPRKTRAEEWLRLPITPDVELAVRAPLDAEQRTRLERCADLIRHILLGRDR
jgi:DNA-binding transcriptional MerR regulator